MKSSWVLPISIFLAAMGLLVDAPAQDQSASCYVAAGIENTHVMVRELDMDDNPKESNLQRLDKPGPESAHQQQKRQNRCQLSPGLL